MTAPAGPEPSSAWLARLEPAGLGPFGRCRTGAVAVFDPGAGLGEVIETGTGRRFPFHAVAIADGTRQVAAETAVSFLLRASPVGTVEAADLLVHEPAARPRDPGLAG